MNTALKLRLLPGLNFPDEISPDVYLHEKQIIKPDESFVMSRDSQGNTLSQYKDKNWDLSPYSSSVKETFLFNFTHDFLSPIYTQEIKRILFMVMLYGKGRKGSCLSVRTLYRYFRILNKLAEFSYKKSISINNLLSNKKLLFQVVIEENLTKITNLFNILFKIGSKRSGLDLQIDKKLLNSIFELERIKKKKEKQTAVIPTSIFLESLKQRWNRFYKIYEQKETLLEFLKFYSLEREKINSWNCIEEYLNINQKIKIFFEEYNINSLNTITKFIGEIQGTCKHLIHSYTGMRDNEVLSLKVNCLENIIDTETGMITKIIGETTKFAGTKKQVKWITTKEIVPIVELLSKIANVISLRHEFREIDLKLFVSAQHLYNKKISFKQKVSFLENKEIPLDLDKLTITLDEQNELEEIDFFRDWQNEDDFKIGKPWQFKTHQYRRSLVVYTIKSGLVSLGGLQVQLKHLFREMSLYYGNGAMKAKELFVVNKGHIADEINNDRAEIEAMEYIRDVIFSDEELFGVVGKYIEKNMKNNLNNKVEYLLENREKTIKLFKSGNISYKSTALGGCVSLEACDKRLTRSFLACLECDSGVIKKEKFDNVIKEQKEFIKCLSIDSVEYRSELEDLEELNKKGKLIFGSTL